MRNISLKWPSQKEVENITEGGGGYALCSVLFCLLHVTIKLFYFVIEMDIRFLTRSCAVHPLFSTAKDFLLGGRPSSSKPIVWSMSGDVKVH